MWVAQYFGCLLIQFPRCAVLGVLHFETGGGEFVAYAVAGGPVFVGLCLGAQVENHVYNMAEGLFAGIVVVAVFGVQTQQLEGKEAHGGG